MRFNYHTILKKIILYPNKNSTFWSHYWIEKIENGEIKNIHLDIEQEYLITYYEPLLNYFILNYKYWLKKDDLYDLLRFGEFIVEDQNLKKIYALLDSYEI